MEVGVGELYEAAFDVRQRWELATKIVNILLLKQTCLHDTKLN
jgi:hypothetical protein